jgi:3-dehydroquinate synthase
MPQLLRAQNLIGKRAVVTNETLRPLYGDALAQQIDAALITIPDGESYKNLETVSSLYDSFVGIGLDRGSVIIALGGGVVGDTVGFAAASFLRGVPFVQIPTSLLSMVDSSVGGKVGVNLPAGKNLVGAFKQPEMVVIDTALLRTLPPVETRCGMAEVIKHGLIADPWLLAHHDPSEITPDYVRRAVQVKIAIVEKDPYEANIRAYLNLGHTFGQAIEAVSGYTWRHGEAVAVGLAAAAHLSVLHGLAGPALVDTVERTLDAVGLPKRFSGYALTDIRHAMDSDKKRKDSKVRFVLLRGIAEPGLYQDVPDALVYAALEAVRSGS